MDKPHAVTAPENLNYTNKALINHFLSDYTLKQSKISKDNFKKKKN